MSQCTTALNNVKYIADIYTRQKNKVYQLASSAFKISIKTQPLRSTTTPVEMEIELQNIEPSYTKVWNSPCSPHGSTSLGKSLKSCSSNCLPTNEESSFLESTHVITAFMPALIISFARAKVFLPHKGNKGVIFVAASIASLYFLISSRKRSP